MLFQGTSKGGWRPACERCFTTWQAEILPEDSLQVEMSYDQRMAQGWDSVYCDLICVGDVLLCRQGPVSEFSDETVGSLETCYNCIGRSNPCVLLENWPAKLFGREEARAEVGIDEGIKWLAENAGTADRAMVARVAAELEYEWKVVSGQGRRWQQFHVL